jgi:hypothetical protein
LHKFQYIFFTVDQWHFTLKLKCVAALIPRRWRLFIPQAHWSPPTHQTTWCHNPQDSSTDLHYHWNHESYRWCTVCECYYRMEGEQETVRVLSRFKSETGEEVSSLLDLPLDVTTDKLQLICNALLKQVSLKCINLLSSAVLHIGHMYHCYPKTMFQVFKYLLYVLRYVAQSCFLSLPPPPTYKMHCSS